MKAEDVVGKEINGSLVCLGCIDKTFSPYEERMYAIVTKPIKRGACKGVSWMKCEVCGCALEFAKQ
jgi:hypothetical protein